MPNNFLICITLAVEEIASRALYQRVPNVSSQFGDSDSKLSIPDGKLRPRTVEFPAFLAELKVRTFWGPAPVANLDCNFAVNDSSIQVCLSLVDCHLHRRCPVCFFASHRLSGSLLAVILGGRDVLCAWRGLCSRQSHSWTW